MDLQQQLTDSYIVQEELTKKFKYMRLEIEKVQGQISKPKLASAQVDQQKDLMGNDKFTKITDSTQTQILSQGLQIYLLGYKQCHLKSIYKRNITMEVQFRPRKVR